MRRTPWVIVIALVALIVVGGGRLWLSFESQGFSALQSAVCVRGIQSLGGSQCAMPRHARDLRNPAPNAPERYDRSACKETIEMVKRIADSHETVVQDMNKAEVARKTKSYGVRSVPAVVIDGKLASCCLGRGPEESVLRSARA